MGEQVLTAVGLETLPAEKARCSVLEGFCRRSLEIVLSLTVLVLLSPILLVISVLLLGEGEGGVFFRQERVGLLGHRFFIIKFRTMVRNAEEQGPLISTSYDDPRITPLGKFLRRSKLDEVPQFLNVLRGEMALVGPRPERPVFHEQFRSIPGWERRLAVKPGVTGPAQINNGIGHDAAKKIVADLQYLKERSLLVDLRVLWQTLMYLASEIRAYF